MARSRNRETEQFSKDEAGNRKDIDETGEKLIPKWVKTAGALAGIIVALLGAFVGIYQVAISLKQIDVNIEKERRGSDEAKAKEAEENRKKAEVEAQQSLAEAASRIQLRQTDLDVKNAEVTKEEIAKAFRDAYFMLDRRIGLFLSLPLSSLDNLAIKREIDKIGQQ